MKKNVLLMVPKRNPRYQWEEADKISLVLVRNKPIDRLMNKVFKTPLNPKVDLDELGSFVWKQCDGSKNLYEVGEALKENFGEAIEPVYDRLLQYIGILKNNNFLKLE